MASKKNYILSKEVATKKLRRMALEIIEHNAGEKHLILAGIEGSGMIVAKSVQQFLAEFSKIKTDLITIKLDKKKPGKITLSRKMDFNDASIIIVDDVANSGKTLLYALKPFLDFHPKKIQTLVLVERSHNDFPVRPDYVGFTVSTTLQEHIIVETDDKKVLGAYLK